MLEYQPFKEFTKGGYTGLYNFYLIENKIVLVAEQLLP